MTQQMDTAIRNLIVAADIAANHWRTASAVALPLRAAIKAVEAALAELPPITDDDIIRMFPVRSADELADVADRLAESEYSRSEGAH